MKERIQLSENLGIAKYAVMQNSIVLYTDGSKTSETTGTVIGSLDQSALFKIQILWNNTSKTY